MSCVDFTCFLAEGDCCVGHLEEFDDVESDAEQENHRDGLQKEKRENVEMTRVIIQYDIII